MPDTHTDPLALPPHSARFEFAELVLSSTDYEGDPSCSFVPYSDYETDAEMGERHFDEYTDALVLLGKAGWSVCAALTNPQTHTTKFLLQRTLQPLR